MTVQAARLNYLADEPRHRFSRVINVPDSHIGIGVIDKALHLLCELLHVCVGHVEDARIPGERSFQSLRTLNLKITPKDPLAIDDASCMTTAFNIWIDRSVTVLAAPVQ